MRSVWWGIQTPGRRPISAAYAARLRLPAGPEKKNRADRIRTCDLFVPNEARYQPALQLAVLESRSNYTWKIDFGKYKIISYAKNSIKNTAWLLMPRGIQVIRHRKWERRETLFLWERKGLIPCCASGKPRASGLRSPHWCVSFPERAQLHTGCLRPCRPCTCSGC